MYSPNALQLGILLSCPMVPCIELNNLVSVTAPGFGGPVRAHSSSLLPTFHMSKPELIDTTYSQKVYYVYCHGANDSVLTNEVRSLSKGNTTGQDQVCTNTNQIMIAGEPYLPSHENILTEADAGVCNSEILNSHFQTLDEPRQFVNCWKYHYVISLERHCLDTCLGEASTSVDANAARQQLFGDSNIECPWNLCPRYRFTQHHLRYIGTFADARHKPGWIFPTAAKILVNIRQTDDLDAWIGQVEGSEERGMFLSNTVEPV